MKTRLIVGICMLLMAILLISSQALAAGGYQIGASAAAGGGGGGQNGGYTQGGTIGQADAAPALSNGAYSLSGGFWQAAFPDLRVYVPVARK